MKDAQSVVLSGRTFVTGALADIFPSRELNPKRAEPGDMKLWCHLQHKGARVWSGQFRAAVYDGRGWRTFRLNIVADSDVRYDSFDERPAKARRCFDAISRLKGQTARPFANSTTWGCTFTLKAPAASDATSHSRTETTAPAKAPAQPAPTPPAEAPITASIPVQTEAAPAAAKTALVPATATNPSVKRASRGRRKQVDDRQLTLF